MKFSFFKRFQFKVKEIHSCDFEHCKETFLKKSDLDLHRTRHTGEFPYSCEIEGCNYTCLSWGRLLLHKSCDHSEGMLIEETQVPIFPTWTYCDLGNCSYKCLFPENLDIHKKISHK